MMSGPWEDFTKPQDDSGPWADFSSPKQMEHKESYRAKPVKGSGSPLDFLSGLGQGFSDIGRGLEQRAVDVGTFLGAVPPFVKSRLQQQEKDIREKREFDPTDTTSTAFGRGSAITAPAVAASFIPGGQSAWGSSLASGLTGAGVSAMLPTTSDLETGTNVLIGGTGSALGNLASRAILPTTARTMTNAQKEILDIARREGIPLRTSEATGSAAIKNFEQMAANRPLTAGMEQRFNEQQTRAINQAVSRRFGKPLAEIGPAERKTAQETIGKELQSLIAGKQVRLDTDLVNAVDAMDIKYSTGGKLTMSPEMQKILDNALSESYRGKVSGETAQSIRSILLGKMRDAARAENTELADVYRTLSDGLNKAIKGSMNAADAEKWAAANRKYMNYKIYEDSLIPSPVEAAGDIPVNRLGSAMERARPNSYLQGKNADLAGIARLGQVIRPPQRSALLGSQGLPVARNIDDLVRAGVQPPLQSRAMQDYLTGQLFPRVPAQRFLRDTPAAQTTLDVLLRSAGLLGSTPYMGQQE